MYLKVKFILSLLNAPSRYKFYLFTFGRIALGLLDLLGVLLIGVLLSKSVGGLGLSGKNSENSSLPLSNYLISFSILQLALMASLAFILKSILSAIFTRYMFGALAKIESELATNSYRYLLNHMAWTTKRYSKSDINYLLNESILATLQILASIVSIVSDIFFLVLILISFALVSLPTTLFILLYFTIIAFTLYKYLGKKFEFSGKVSMDSGIEIRTLLNDSVQSFREIISLNRENFFLEKFRNKKFEGAKASFYVQFLNNLPRYIIESALIIGVLGIIFFSFQPDNPEQSAQSIGIFLTGSMRIMSSFLPLQTALSNYKYQKALSEKFIEFENLTNAIRNSNSNSIKHKLTKSWSFLGPIGLQVENLIFQYDDSKTQVINDLNISIKPGQLVAIIGPSGSGKSTLADLLIGIEKPTSGTIKFFSKDSDELSRKDFRVGYVSQNPGKIYGSIKNNIAFGQVESEINYDTLRESIEIAHLSDVFSTLDQGYETHLGEQSDALSGGQMQRIGLARALYNKPNLLVLDEATSALDAESEFAVTESLNNLRKSCTIIVIAHKLATVQNADLVFVVNEGKVVASGTFSDLAKSNEMVARFIRLSELQTS